MSGNRLVAYVIGLGSVAVLVLVSSPKLAHACGGFFCSANAPVNQAAERIIFSKNDDETVTAVVLIGSGRTFIAGADIKEFGKITSGRRSGLRLELGRASCTERV